jgi:hypothetical protein
VAGFCEHGNEPPSALECREFLESWTGGLSRRTVLCRVSQLQAFVVCVHALVRFLT